MREKIKTIRERVEDILKDTIQARNSDKFLIWEFWRREGFLELNKFGKYALSFESFKKATNPASIIRARASIQNDDKRDLKERYLPTNEDVARKRKIAEKEWHDAMQDVKQGRLDI